MPQTSICRLCLCTDVRMFTIAGTPLQAVYEKITDSELLDNMKPVAACYICHAHLRRCRSFMEKSVRADEVLTGFLMNNKLTVKTVARIDRKSHNLVHSLSIKKMSSEDHLEVEESKVKTEVEFEFAGAEDVNDMSYEDHSDFPAFNETEVQLDEKAFVLRPENEFLENVEYLKEEKQLIASDADENRNADSDDERPLNTLKSNLKCRSDDSAGRTTTKRTVASVKKTLKKAAVKKSQQKEKKRFSAKLTKKAYNEDNNTTDKKALRRIMKFEQVESTNVETKAVQNDDFLKVELKDETVEAKRLKCLVRVEDKYVCQFCGRTFANKRQMLGHLPQHRPYECDACQKRFLRGSHLRQHTKIHTGEKPFECDICHWRLSTVFNLKRHLLKHTGEKPYQCNVCGIRLCKTSDLNRHMRTHTGELPYECNVCHRRFNRKGNMKTHLKQHTGEKPYQCNICGARFCQSVSLQIHLRKHTGEKPFECNVCNRKFSQKANLTTHLKKHTGEKPYECNICQRRFNQKGNLYTHQKKHTKKSDHEKVSEKKDAESIASDQIKS